MSNVVEITALNLVFEIFPQMPSFLTFNLFGDVLLAGTYLRVSQLLEGVRWERTLGPILLFPVLLFLLSEVSQLRLTFFLILVFLMK